MARKNRSNRPADLGLPKLYGFKPQAEVVPDPTKPPPTPSPRVALDAPAVDAVETPGAVPRDKRTWPLTPPSKPPPKSGKQPPLRPMAPPPGKAHRTDAEGVGNGGRRVQREKKMHGRPVDPDQCYWANSTCPNPPTKPFRFCPEHWAEYRQQRRGWSD